MLKLQNKVIIITGGTRGIGLETARLFYENGAKVIIFGSKKETVDNAIEQLKNENINIEGYYPNLDNFKEINNTINEIYEKYGFEELFEMAKNYKL